MKSKLLSGIVLLVLIFVAWLFLSKLLPTILFVIACFFTYRAVKAIHQDKALSAVKNLFGAYLFIIPASIMQGSLIVHWKNFPKIFF